MKDYEKMFERLKEQILTELSWAEADDETRTAKKSFKEGMVFAYKSIAEMVEYLESDTFEEEEDKEEYYDYDDPYYYGPMI